jgi:8-oxo-dGTP pyrophosphatase MutT (NUDIX family)
MPSAYACVYYVDGNQVRNVIIATKRQQARWLGWNGVDYIVPYTNPVQRSINRTAYNIINNPTQPVFPGGRMNQNDTPTTCAIREFLEETGVNLANYQAIQQTSVMFNNLRAVTAQAAQMAFAALYFRVSHDDFNAILLATQQNILANNNAATTVDDELATAVSSTAANALNSFHQANNIGPAGQGVFLGTNWFETVTSNIPAN